MAGGSAASGSVRVRELATRDGLKIGHATLDSEKSINALTVDMVRTLDRALIRWSADPAVACVVIDGAGEKGFCAGADVRTLRTSALEHRGAGPNPTALAFFGEEYRLDHRIHTYPKPVLVWGGGVVMGGGLGLLAGASHRVLTETSRIAMPEITIGLFPDVGGSWFLPKMPGGAGLFLALTGVPINAADALQVGLADAMLKASDRGAVLDRLATTSFTGRADDDRATLTKLLAAFAHEAESLKPASKLVEHAAYIARLASGATLEDVCAAITGYAGDDAWLQRAAKTLASGSPTTAALTWELFARARGSSLADVFRLELIVALQCLAHPDFPEGVRALLVDKDQRPVWAPVTAESIAAHFVPPWPAQDASPLADLG